MIEKFFFALSSVLVFEGLMIAILPNRIKEAVKMIEKTESSTLSRLGLFLAGIGILFLYLIEI